MTVGELRRMLADENDSDIVISFMNNHLKLKRVSREKEEQFDALPIASYETRKYTLSEIDEFIFEDKCKQEILQKEFDLTYD